MTAIHFTRSRRRSTITVPSFICCDKDCTFRRTVSSILAFDETSASLSMSSATPHSFASTSSLKSKIALARFRHPCLLEELVAAPAGPHSNSALKFSHQSSWIPRKICWVTRDDFICSARQRLLVCQHPRSSPPLPKRRREGLTSPVLPHR